MKIEIWSDFVCPFCYIGKANLLQALHELNINDAEIVWRSFELDPSFLNLKTPVITNCYKTNTN